MSTSKWSSSLANVETRIRRSLGIAGPIGAQLPDDPLPIQPVVLVDDATRPGGHLTVRGRSWMSYFQVQGISDVTYTGNFLQVDDTGAGAIIDGFDMTATMAATKTAPHILQLIVYGDVATASQPNVDSAPIRLPMFVENMRNPQDYAPLKYAVFTNAAPPTGSGAYVGNWEIPAGPGTFRLDVPLRIFVQPSGWIGLVHGPNLDSADAFRWCVTWKGRAY